MVVNHEVFLRGVTFFNRGEFFDAHEILEDVWRDAPPKEKKALQGLIQVAVAFHHYSTGNLRGARSLLARATSNLNATPENCLCLELETLLTALAEWQSTLEAGAPPPPLPQLVIRR